MIDSQTKEALIEGINNYLANGYVIAESFNDPLDDVIESLNSLLSLDSSAAEECCKKTLENNHIDSCFFKSICLNDLLLSEHEWSYAFDYLSNNIENVSVPELEKTLFYFYCAKNEADPYPVPDGLFKKLMERYRRIKDEPDAKIYHLHEAYNDFVKAYGLSYC